MTWRVVAMAIDEFPSGFAVNECLKPALECRGIGESHGAKVLVVRDVELRSYMFGAGVKDEGDGAGVHRGEANVNALPAPGGPSFGRGGVVLIDFVEDEGWAPEDLTIAGVF